MTATNSEQESAVLVEQVGPIRRLIMNRPKSRNALSEEMMEALAKELDNANNDDATRVVVIAANGPVFCAGHNLKELTARRSDPDHGRHYFALIMRTCSTLMQAIVNMPKIVIAEVQGTATAAGLQLVATCDLAICVNESNFCTPGVNIGLFCSTPMVALTRAVPRKQAMEMLVTGEEIDAHTAKAYGIVNRVVPLEYLRLVVDKYATEIAQKSAHALKFGKETFYRQADMNLADAYDLTSLVMTENMLAADSEEGISAFLAKRSADWPSLK
ncbi:enoyl-CoA hydratase [Cohaesibacter celericrescens]|uniref:Enoyl-CoA hydratase domain-containing protein 3, mitochondrial n=1 Tax=Cohaesibacter celericrescens TaxID=2067669 RepID=A0A2N5XQF0_9HYPH|nr:enoyl-CoA hydratase [Cohaesibacter celericrescens]PLW76695.1 enoyl-CoA hydratase [Cohaesibacter celericrescens]